MKVYILLKAFWYFSQNAGEECENEVVAVFTDKDILDKYLLDKGIELKIIYDAYSTPLVKDSGGPDDKESYFVSVKHIKD